MDAQQLGLMELAGIAGALSALVGLGTWIIKRVNKAIVSAVAPIKLELETSIKNNKEATLSTLRYSITRAHEEYMDKGYIGRHSFQCIHEMHDQYKALGGNSFVASLVQQMDKLPHDLREEK